jgi:hypothetical protein
MKVLLSDIVEVMQMPAEDEKSYVELETGEVITVLDEEFEKAATDKPIEFFPDWDQGPIALAREVLRHPERYQKLPVARKNAENKIMERFGESIDDPVVEEALKDALVGAEALRAFKSVIFEFSLEKDWFRFRDRFYRSAAVRWCRKNNMEYETD